jgi:hypothetical protein
VRTQVQIVADPVELPEGMTIEDLARLTGEGYATRMGAWLRLQHERADIKMTRHFPPGVWPPSSWAFQVRATSLSTAKRAIDAVVAARQTEWDHAWIGGEDPLHKIQVILLPVRPGRLRYQESWWAIATVDLRDPLATFTVTDDP